MGSWWYISGKAGKENPILDDIKWIKHAWPLHALLLQCTASCWDESNRLGVLRDLFNYMLILFTCIYTISLNLLSWQFELICDKRALGMVSATVFFIGTLVSDCFCGILSDKIGRKPVMMVFGVCASIFSLGAAFSYNYWLYSACRFFVGLSYCKYCHMALWNKIININLLYKIACSRDKSYK